MTTIQDLEERLNSFEQTLLQMARNNVPITVKTDETSNRVDEITPYKETKVAYYGEKEKVFYGVPSGELSVFFDNEYTTERIEDRLYVRFERLNETKDITIMVQ